MGIPALPSCPTATAACLCSAPRRLSQHPLSSACSNSCPVARLFHPPSQLSLNSASEGYNGLLGRGDCTAMSRNQGSLRDCRGSMKELTVCGVTGVTSDSASSLEKDKVDDGTNKPDVHICGKPLRGRPLPFGPAAINDGVNFSVHSSGASAVSLCLYTEADLEKGIITEEIKLNPRLNKTGDVWHIFLPGIAPNLLYGYRVDGRFSPEEGCCYDPKCILVDPYAKAVISRGLYGMLGPGGNCWPQMAGMVPPLEEDEVFSHVLLTIVANYKFQSYFSHGKLLFAIFICF